MVEYCVISDTHRGVQGDGANDFHQDLPLALFLRALHHQGIKPILAGDTEELWQFKQDAIEDSNAWSSGAIEHYAYAIVVGNHDNVPIICNRPTVEEFSVKGKLLVMHGHRFDKLNFPPFTWIGRSISWAAGHAERLFGPDADKRMEEWARKKLGRGRYCNPSRYRKKALALATKRGFDKIVLGHTHVHAPVWRGYGNSGTWTGQAQGKLFISV